MRLSGTVLCPGLAPFPAFPCDDVSVLQSIFSQLAEVTVLGMTGRHWELVGMGLCTVGRGQRMRGTCWDACSDLS